MVNDNHETTGLVRLESVTRDVWTKFERWSIAQHGLSEGDPAAIPRDLAASIVYRADACLLHLRLLKLGLDDGAALITPAARGRVNRAVLRDTSLLVQMLFDDLVFNSASAFDYTGCLIGFVAEGEGSHEIEWKKAVGKVKHAPGLDLTRVAVKQVHNSFVYSLFRYRSETIHFKSDGVPAKITYSLVGQSPKLRIGAPHGFERWLLKPERTADEDGTPIKAAAEHLLELTVTSLIHVLEALAIDISALEPIGPPTRPEMLFARWDRAGVFEAVVQRPGSRQLGIVRFGAITADASLRLLGTRADGSSLESTWIDCARFLGDPTNVDEACQFLDSHIAQWIPPA
jgi:hypothetical protein